MPCTALSMQHAACSMQHATCLVQHATCNMQHAICNMPCAARSERWSQKPTRSSELSQHRTVSRGSATRVHCTPARPHTRGVCCMAWRCSLLLGHADVHRSLHGRAAVRRAAEYCTQSTVLRRPHPVRDRPGPVLSDDARCTHAPTTARPSLRARGTHFRRRRALWFRTTRNVGAGHAREVSPHSGRRRSWCCSVASCHVAALHVGQVAPRLKWRKPALIHSKFFPALQVRCVPPSAPSRFKYPRRVRLGFRTPSWCMRHVGDYPPVVRPPAAVRPTDSVMACTAQCSQYAVHAVLAVLSVLTQCMPAGVPSAFSCECRLVPACRLCAMPLCCALLSQAACAPHSA
jgi:hypothetical protein